MLSFTFAINKGAASGALSGIRAWFQLITLAVLILVLVLWILIRRRPHHPTGPWALICIAGGVAGNLVDRFGVDVFPLWFSDNWVHGRSGYVIDVFMLPFLNDTVFNLADVCILLGCVLFFVYWLKRLKRKESHADPHPL